MMNKTKLTLGLAMSAIMLATVLAPQDAMAHKRKHRHSHHRGHHSSSSISASSALASKVEMLEAQLRATQDEVTALRSAGGQGASVADSSKVQELDAWMQESKAKPAKAKDNMVFFRGGFARNDQQHIATTSNLSCTNGIAGSGLVGCNSTDKDAWYFGAGFDFSLDDDLFGLAPNTELLAELMFDYSEFGKFTGNVTGAIGLSNSAHEATQSQLRLTAAPKIKFMKGSAFRPWIIPAGFTINVISPPSQLNTITELMPAMHFGAGADYNIWRNLYVGADVRYNWALNKLDGTNTNGLTAGGYLGIGF